jgi:iron(III) transport system permease protein
MPGVAKRRAGLRLPSGQAGIIALIAGALLILLVVPPIFILLQRSFFVTNPDGSIGAFTLEYYARLIQNRRFTESLYNSLIFSVFSTIVALTFGGILAWLVERTDTRFKALAYLTTIISMGTPYILYVSAWLFLLGKSGPFNDLYRMLSGDTEPLFNVYSLWGMILIEGFLWSPLVFLLLSATFRSANADMEEAARMSGASVLQTVWHISIKISLPAILALALFVFIRAIEAFEVPAIVGLPGRVNVLTTDVYRRLAETIPPDLGFASAYSVVLLVLVAILLYFYSRLSRNAERYYTVTGKGYRPRMFQLGSLRWAGSAIVIFNFLIILVLPLIAVIWLSLLTYIRGFSFEAIGNFTLDNFRHVLTSDYYYGLAWNTIVVSAGAATATMIITLFVGWLAARRHAGGLVLDQMATTPLIFPGIVMGVAMMLIFLSVPIPVYHTLWIIFIAYAVRYLPYGMRYTYSGMLQIHKELEEAAGVSGASQLTTLRRVIAPLLSPAILAGWLFIFLLGAKELAVAILLAGPRSQTIAVAMYDLWVNSQGGELAALGLIWAFLMTLVATAFYFTARRQAQMEA